MLIVFISKEVIGVNHLPQFSVSFFLHYVYTGIIFKYKIIIIYYIQAACNIINIYSKQALCYGLYMHIFTTVKYKQFCITFQGFPNGTTGIEPACQCRRHKRHRFDPWVRTIPWRRAWQPFPVFLLGKSHGQRSLAGYGPQSHKDSDTTEATQHTHHILQLRKVR